MSTIKQNRVLVTGGGGFIGSHVVDLLVAAGKKVIVLDNFSTGKIQNIKHHLDSDSITLVKGSVTDPFDVAKALQGVDTVYHLACLGVRHSIAHPFENHRVNSEGTLLLLQEALRLGVKRFVSISSSEVYGTAEFTPMNENHPVRPHTVYGASKLAGERYAMAYHDTYGMNITVVRPFNAYGPRSHYEGLSGEMIPRSIVKALSGEAPVVFGDGKQTRDFTYVEDTARGILAIGECEATNGATLNLGTGSELSMIAVAEMILNKTERSSIGIRHLDPRPGDVKRLCADVSELRKFLDWRPSISFEEGIQRTISWLKEQPEGSNMLAAQASDINWE
jgi:UDP-glucose 4-epimerase